MQQLFGLPEGVGKKQAGKEISLCPLAKGLDDDDDDDARRGQITRGDTARLGAAASMAWNPGSRQ